MNHSFVFVLLFTCFSFEFCGCFAFCCFFFFLTFSFYFVFLFCVFFLYFRFGIHRCVSVLGLGFPFWLALDQQNNNGLYVHHAFCTFHFLHCTITT